MREYERVICKECQYRKGDGCKLHPQLVISKAVQLGGFWCPVWEQIVVEVEDEQTDQV